MRRIVMCCAILALLVPGLSPAQDPLGHRSSIVINEIMPFPADPNECPWIELFAVDGSLTPESLAVQIGPFHSRRVLGAWEQEADRLPVICLVINGCERCLGGPLTDSLRTEPFESGFGEMANHGEIRLRHMGVETGRTVDYVAWGRPGTVSADDDPGIPWHRGDFVTHGGGFGVYDPDSNLVRGQSIGLHPGANSRGAMNWVSYPPGLASPGRWNAVPPVSDFSLADQSVIGSRSLAIAWSGHTLTESYRIHVGRAGPPPVVEVERVLPEPAFRIGSALAPGRYLIELTAFSQGIPSPPSDAFAVDVVDTPCELPLLRNPRRLPSVGRLPAGSHDCSSIADASCRWIEGIDFRFQRKDTPKQCPLCDPSHIYCAADKPHPYCVFVAIPDGGHDVLACADASISPHCGPGGGIASGIVPLPTPGTQGRPMLPPMRRGQCGHGIRNCARASISMMVSAYGSSACLSQDVIAEAHSKRCNTPIHPDKSLGHNKGMNCFTRCDSDCSMMLAWALGLPDGAFCRDTHGVLYRNKPPDFAQLQAWINADRPVMSRMQAPKGNTSSISGTDHIRVVAGWCTDETEPKGSAARNWVYVYDPASGPRVESFESWRRTALDTWVGYPTTSPQAANVEVDPPGLW
jgi:hypothetical protein